MRVVECKSRIGRTAINLPASVTCKSTGSCITVTGPKGEVKDNCWSPDFELRYGDNCVSVVPTGNALSSAWGAMKQRLLSLVIGVSEGWRKTVVINGVGYKAEKKPEYIEFALGKSLTQDKTHQDKLWFASDKTKGDIPKSVAVEINKEGTRLTLSGPDAQLLGQVAGRIKRLRPRNPYKGRGIYVEGEYLINKAVKKK